MKWLHVLSLKCLDLIKAKSHVKAHFRRHKNGSLVYVKDFDMTRDHADHIIESGKTYKINNPKSKHHGKHAKVTGYMPGSDKKKHYVMAMVDGKRTDLKPEHFEHIDGGFVSHSPVIRRTSVLKRTPVSDPTKDAPAAVKSPKRPGPTKIKGKRPDAPYILDPKDVLGNEYSFTDILEDWQKENPDLKVAEELDDGNATRYVFKDDSTRGKAGWIQISNMAKRPHKVFFDRGELSLPVADLYKRLCKGWRNENGGRLDLKSAFGDIGIKLKIDSAGDIFLTGSTYTFKNELRKRATYDRVTKTYKMDDPKKIIETLEALPPFYTKEELDDKKDTTRDDADTTGSGTIDPLGDAITDGDGSGGTGTLVTGGDPTGSIGGTGGLPATPGKTPRTKKLKDYNIEGLVKLIHTTGVKSPDSHIKIRPAIMKALTLYDHQKEGAEIILSSFDAGRKGFLLADDVGTGKTYTGAAVLAQMKPKRAIICVPSDGVRQQWIQELKKVGIDAITANGGKTDYSKTKGVLICTDTTLGLNETLHDNPCDLFMLDEAHRMKNLAETVKKSDRAEAALTLIQHNMVSGGKTLYMTATPYEKPWQAKIYEALEMWPAGGFDRWLNKHGVNVKLRTTFDPVTGKTTEKRAFALVGNGRSAVKRTLMSHIRNIAAGKFLSREVQPGGVALTNHFHKINLDPATKKQYDVVMQFFADAQLAAKGSKHALFIAGQRVLWARRFMEAAKLPAAIDAAKSELLAGRKVCIMTGYKSKTSVSDFADRVIDKVDNMNPGAIATFRDSLKALGEHVDGTFDTLRAEFPNAVFYHGGMGGKAKENAKNDYNNGKATVFIATQAAADTGISLHDTVGDAPRSQINLTLPWSAIQMKQLAGRSHRLGTKSDTKMHWMFADDPREQENALMVAKKMEIMGATSAGIDVANGDDLYKRLADFDMADGTGVDYKGFRPTVMKKSFIINHVIRLKK